MCLKVLLSMQTASTEQKYWEKKLVAYSQADWGSKPSMFAQWVRKYLPVEGKLLEIGAGVGQDSTYFTNEGFDVTATDISRHALNFMRNNGPAASKIRYLDGARPLPFPDNSFEVVYANLSLHYFDSQTTEALFAEIHRVLKPSGTLSALFNSTNDPEANHGKQIEPGYREINGITKRFVSPEDARRFVKDFQVEFCDSGGATYKDEAKGVHGLTRLICKKGK